MAFVKKQEPLTRLAPRNGSVLATLSRRGRGTRAGLTSRELLRLDQAASAADFGEVMVGVAEHRVDRGDALEIMPDLVLHGHADAAMAPTASAHNAAMASSTTRRISPNAPPASPIIASGPTATFASVTSAARWPSIV